MTTRTLAPERNGLQHLATIAVSLFARGWGFAGLSVASIGAIATVELLAQGLGSLGALVLLPVAVAAWMLDGLPLSVVVAAAVLSRAVAWSWGGLDAGTAGAETLAIVLITASTRLAAVSTARRRAAERLVAAQELSLARFDERERIAGHLQSAAVNRLFAVTLAIEAALELPPEHASKRLREAVAELDQLCADMRAEVFRPGN